MSSRIAQELSLTHPPLALYFSPDDPPAARSFKKEKSNKGGWSCAMFLLGQALDGKTVSFSLDTCHCPGAAAGMGLCANSFDSFPGGLQAFTYFLSSGNQNWEQGRQTARQMRDGGAANDKVEMYLEGEGYKKTPELALDFTRQIPHIEAKGPYVILEPLDKLPPEAEPEAVIFLADALQLSALVYLVNFARTGLDSVRIPFSSGCQSIGALPMFEATQEVPKAIVGLTDISARLYLRKILGRDFLSFAVPWSLYQEMEGNVGESFLVRQTWNKIVEK